MGSFGIKNGSTMCFSKKKKSWTIWGAQTSERSLFEPILSNFGPSQIRKSLENGPFWDHNGLKNGSKQNQKNYFFHARVRLEVVISGLQKCFHLFCMAQCGSRGCVSLVLPIFVDQYSGIWLSLLRDPINQNQCLSPSKSSASIVFGVPFHFNAIQL